MRIAFIHSWTFRWHVRDTSMALATAAGSFTLKRVMCHCVMLLKRFSSVILELAMDPHRYGSPSFCSRSIFRLFELQSEQYWTHCLRTQEEGRQRTVSVEGVKDFIWLFSPNVFCAPLIIVVCDLPSGVLVLHFVGGAMWNSARLYMTSIRARRWSRDRSARSFSQLCWMHTAEMANTLSPTSKYVELIIVVSARSTFVTSCTLKTSRK